MHKLQTWKPRIDATRTEAQLLEVMREYCDGWLPSDLSQLPQVCQDCRPGTAEELGHMAVDFKRAELSFSGSAEAAQLLHEMSQVFTHAAERLRIFHHPILRNPAQ